MGGFVQPALAGPAVGQVEVDRPLHEPFEPRLEPVTSAAALAGNDGRLCVAPGQVAAVQVHPQAK